MRYRLLGLSIIGVFLYLTPVSADEEISLVLGRLADIDARLDNHDKMFNEGQLPAATEADKSPVDLTNIIEKLTDMQKRIQALEEKSGASVMATSEKRDDKKDDKKKDEFNSKATETDDADAILMDLAQKGGTEKPSQAEREATLKAEQSAPTLSTNNFEAQYNEGLGLLKKGEYKAAIASFDYCLKTFPNEKKDDRILYHLGKSYYGRKNYEQAKISYVKAYQKNPNGSLAPHALFGLSQAFVQENSIKKACVILANLNKKHPKLDTQLAKDVAAAKKDNNCKG